MTLEPKEQKEKPKTDEEKIYDLRSMAERLGPSLEAIALLEKAEFLEQQMKQQKAEQNAKA